MVPKLGNLRQTRGACMVKLAFLFLTIGPIHHESHWQDFFIGNQERYSVYVHAKNPLPSSSPFKPYELTTTEPTSWANTMKAQIALLKQALMDPLNATFIFVSETTLPLQTFDTTYSTLMQHPESMFYYTPNPHTNRNISSYVPLARNLQPIPVKRQYKNSQWIILNRKHAQLMVDDNEYIDIITRYSGDQEHYPSTFLINQGLIDEILPQDFTYVEWHVGSPHFPYEFTDFTKAQELSMMAHAINSGYLFARKIMPHAQLAPLDPLLAYRKNPTSSCAYPGHQTRQATADKPQLARTHNNSRKAQAAYKNKKGRK